MAFNLSGELTYLVPSGIVLEVIGVFIWFVVSLVQYARYDGTDDAHRQRLRFQVMLSGILWLLSIISIVALVIYILWTARFMPCFAAATLQPTRICCCRNGF
ncbi:MAG: hypothetical protein ACI4J3_03870 [Oscillospiraceae bacterium]